MIVAFDFDGTLCDSMGALEDLAVSVIREHWVISDEEYLRRRYRETSGDPFVVQMPQLVLGKGREVDIAVSEFERLKPDVIASAKPIDMVVNATEDLIHRGHRVHVISSSRMMNIRHWLVEHVRGHDEILIHSVEIGTKLEHLAHCRPDVFIGDSESDRTRAESVGTVFVHAHDIDAWMSGVGT